MKVKVWDAKSQSPWLTRAEAADYLRWSVRTVDRCLIPMGSQAIHGKLRYEVQESGGRRKVRILAADVYAICPLPPDFEPPQPFPSPIIKLAA